MLNVATKDFRAAMAIAMTAAPYDWRNPIMGTIRAVANGRLVLDATDLDMRATVAIACETKKEGSFLIHDPKLLNAAIHASGADALRLAGTKDGYSAEAGALTRKAQHRMEVEEFPADGVTVRHCEWAATAGEDFIRQLGRLASAISEEETRYYLNGVHMHHVDGWTYRLVATDGHRLITIDVALPDASGTLQPMIMPRRFVHAMLKHFRRIDGPVRLQQGFAARLNTPAPTLDADRAEFRRVSIGGKVGNSDVTLSSKLIDGTFPDYRRVIPVEPPMVAVFDAAALRRGVLCINSGTGERINDVAFTFDPAGVELSCPTAPGVTATYRIEGRHSMPRGWKVGLNGGYLLDMLASLGGEQVSMGCTGDSGDRGIPTLWRRLDDTAFTGVVMPMRV